MHKEIPIIVSEQSKISLRDFLVEKSYSGGWDDYIYDKLKEISLNTKALILTGELSTVDKRKVTFTESDLADIKIIHKELPSKDKTTFTVGIIMYEALENSYKIQSFADKKLKSKEPISSFEEYINDSMQAVLKNAIINSYNNELDKERKEIKNPNTPKPNKKQ